MFYMFQLFVCIKSLKSFKIVELHPKEGTPSQEVNVIFLSGLVSLFLSLRGRCRTWSDKNVSPWNSVIFPHLRAVDSEVLVGVVCSLCAQMCWCTALGPTAVCNLPLGVSISVWPLASVCIYPNLSSLGFLTTTAAWSPDSRLSYAPGGKAFLPLSQGALGCSCAQVTLENPPVSMSWHCS